MALQDMFSLLHDSELYEPTSLSSPHVSLALITQYYNDKSPGKDTLVALVKNLMNPFISDIYVYNHDSTQDFSHLPNSEKLHFIETNRKDRIGFRDALDFASSELKGRLVILGIHNCVYCLFYFHCTAQPIPISISTIHCSF